jgi:hypothetical protein
MYIITLLFFLIFPDSRPMIYSPFSSFLLEIILVLRQT